MTLKQFALDVYTKLMQSSKPEAEAVKDEVKVDEVKPEIPVKMAEEAAPVDAPAEDKKDEASLETRIADLEAAVKQAFELLDKIGAPKEDVEMSKEIEVLKGAIATQKEELEKFAAQPDGKVASKKKKETKPEIEHAGMKRMLA